MIDWLRWGAGREALIRLSLQLPERLQRPLLDLLYPDMRDACRTGDDPPAEVSDDELDAAWEHCRRAECR